MPYRNMDLGDTSLATRSFPWRFYLKKAFNAMSILTPIIRYFVQTVLGLLFVGLIIGAFWCAFPGAWLLGGFVSGKLGWDNVAASRGELGPLAPWFVGVIVGSGPFWLAGFGRALIKLVTIFFED